MHGDPETRRESLAFPAIDPASGQKIAIQLAYEKLKALPRSGLGRVKEAAYVLPQVLSKPTAIFEGFLHDGDEPKRGAGWRCYCGKPTICFEDNGRQLRAREGFVFLVFVTDENIAYNWRWDQADQFDASLPRDWQDRFQRKLL